MRCPRCQQDQDDDREECSACGVVFARYRPRLARIAPESPQIQGWRGWWGDLKARATWVDPEPNPIVVTTRALFWLVLLAFTVAALRQPIQDFTSILHLIHLPFHEAGHIVFSPFGRFLQVLGGTLGQLLVPVLVLGSFLLRQQPFGAAVGLWWLGHSFLDCAPYIHDARAGQLELLGGVTGSEVADYHDWEVLLGMLGWLKHDHALARLAWFLGALCLLAALAWSARQLWREIRVLQRR